jgi:integrase
MKPRYRLFRRRSGIFFLEDCVSRQQESLRTKDKDDARRLFAAKNEAHQQPALNLQIARAYLMAIDPAIGTRTWQHAMDVIVSGKEGETQRRWLTATKDAAFDALRRIVILETQAEQFLKVLHAGTVSTNVYLRRLHNFALDMNWLPWPVIPKRQWPAVRFREKRAITQREHQSIVTWETNPERRNFYELCWHLGGAQSDVVSLQAEDIDWQGMVISFSRKKTGTMSMIHFGPEAEKILRSLPKVGPLFPNFRRFSAGHRATEFARACRREGITGVTLHSYRYAWAERAKQCGYPERFAQEALGHNSKAVHRSYARKAQVKLPSLEEYEKAVVKQKVVAVKFDRCEAAKDRVATAPS